MNILHVFNSLTEDTGNFDRLKKMNANSAQYVLSCDKKKLPDFSIHHFHRTTYFQFPKLEVVKNFFFNQASLKCFQEKLGNITFDVVHSYFAYPSASAGQAIAKKIKAPHIVTVRGSDVLIYPTQGLYLKNKISEILRDADLVICLSNHLMEACKKLGVASGKMIHLPEGHDEKVFFADEKLKKENFILFAGNLISVKNPLRLLNAFDIVSKNNPTISLKIAGSGVLEGEMQSIINQKKLQKKIEFLGQIPANLLANQMRRAKLLILPSLSEGWPNVIQESLACGTPVVASKVGGIPEIITNGENGFLCDHLSEQDIANQITKALGYTWEISKIQKIPSLYTRDKVIAKVFELYQQVALKNKKIKY